jgi:MFS family permease
VTSSAHGWRSHYTLVVLMLVYMMSVIDRQIMGILMEPIKREFDVSDTAMGLLTGLTFALFYAGLGVPFGRYADRANRRNFIAYCCAVWSGMTALCGLATGYASLAFARIGVAVGEAGATAPSLSMISDHYPPAKRGRAMSIFWLGPQLAMLFGLTLGGWIAHNYGWRMAFLAMGIPGVILAVLLRLTTMEPQRGHWEAVKPSTDREPFMGVVRDLWASRAFVRITMVGLMMGFAGYGIGIWTPAFLVRSHGMSLQAAGAVMGLVGGTAAVLGTLVSGWLCDTLSRRDPRWRLGVPAIGCLLAVPSGTAFFMMETGGHWLIAGSQVPHAVGFYLLFALTAASWTAPINSALPELIPSQRRATSLAIFNLGLTMVGAGFGPLFVGLLSDALAPVYGNEGLRWALALSTGVCYLLGFLIFLTALNPFKQERIPAAA